MGLGLRGLRLVGLTEVAQERAAEPHHDQADDDREGPGVAVGLEHAGQHDREGEADLRDPAHHDLFEARDVNGRDAGQNDASHQREIHPHRRISPGVQYQPPK